MMELIKNSVIHVITLTFHKESNNNSPNMFSHKKDYQKDTFNVVMEAYSKYMMKFIIYGVIHVITLIP